jgi:hypothetical protein
VYSLRFWNSLQPKSWRKLNGPTYIEQTPELKVWTKLLSPFGGHRGLILHDTSAHESGAEFQRGLPPCRKSSQRSSCCSWAPESDESGRLTHYRPFYQGGRGHSRARLQKEGQGVMDPCVLQSSSDSEARTRGFIEGIKPETRAEQISRNDYLTSRCRTSAIRIL